MTATVEAIDQIEQQEEYEAEYMLEAPVQCPLCRQTLDSVRVVRLLRTKVNFTSTLPRRGYVSVCPSCRGIVPAAMSGRLT
jgi:hypothetical protein